MEDPSIKKESNAFERLNDDVLDLILRSLYEACLHKYDSLETRERQIRAVKMLLPLGYTSRSFAKLVLPYVWKYVRIITSSARSYNIKISETLRNDNLLFPYGEYLKELEINFTVHQGDVRRRNTPDVSSLLQVVASRCTSICQLNFIAKVGHKYKDEYNDRNINENAVNHDFRRYMDTYSNTIWNDFKNLVSKAFGQGSLKDVTLGSDFILMDDECLINITRDNRGIEKLSLRGSQFTHKGIETALQYLGDSLRELEIYNLGDGSTKASRGSPLNITIDSLLRPCRNLQSIYLVGIKYGSASKSETYSCPLKSITTIQVDEETLTNLFTHVNEQTLFQINITSSYDVVKWDSFLRSFVLPLAKRGSLENLVLYILRCKNHRYSSHALDPKIIMKNIMNTLQISENTTNLLCSELKQWKIFVGNEEEMYSIESEGVDFVSRECILDYDRLDLSEYSLY